MNTSPKVQAWDVSFEEVFRDLVRITPCEFPCFILIRSHKGKEWREATYAVYDLWDKDEKGEWGKSLGFMSGGVRGAIVASHQTRVWKLVPSHQPLLCKRGRHPRPRSG